MEEIKSPKSTRVLQPIKRKRPKLIIGVILIILIIGLLAGFYLARPKNPFPDNIRKEAVFPLYYPEKMPEGYKLDKNSIKIENNIMFFTLENEKQKVTISEQTAPDQQLDLKQTPGFAEVPATAGEATVGQVNNQYVSILITDKTMVNIYGSKDVPREAVVKIVQSMAENK